jgi:hypothetical protein
LRYRHDAGGRKTWNEDDWEYCGGSLADHDVMTSDEFRACLARLHWTLTDLSNAFGGLDEQLNPALEHGPIRESRIGSLIGWRT